jgi:hypothetical protein
MKRYHSAVGGAALHDLAAAKRLAEKKPHLGDFSQYRRLLCPSDRVSVEKQSMPVGRAATM